MVRSTIKEGALHHLNLVVSYTSSFFFHLKRIKSSAHKREKMRKGVIEEKGKIKEKGD